MVDDIATLLATPLTGVTICKGELPPTPIEAVALVEYSGRPAAKTLNRGEKLSRPSLQVIARGMVYATVRARLQTVEDTIDELSNVTIGGTVYTSIDKSGDVMPLGPRTEGAVSLVQNYQIERAR
jgi:hypothetical protein